MLGVRVRSGELFVQMARPLTAARPDQPRRLVSVTEFARHADVSTRTVRRWIAAGHLTGYRVGPRLIKVDLVDLNRITQPIPTAPDAA